jgi:hypothetical protein
VNIVQEGIASSHRTKLEELERGYQAKGAVMKPLEQAKAELGGGPDG